MLGDMSFIGELMRIGTRHHETWRAEKEPVVVKTEPEVTAAA